MTTLTSKLNEVNTRLQRLTIWKPNERDPFLELDRWRRNAHSLIEEIFVKKRQQIEALIEKHEREFTRQIVRQRTLLEILKRKWISLNENPSHASQQAEISVQNDLIKIEEDILTRLGRAQILIETSSINFQDSIQIQLKKYLANPPAISHKELNNSRTESLSSDWQNQSRKSASSEKSRRLSKQLEELQQSNRLSFLTENRHGKNFRPQTGAFLKPKTIHA